MWQDRGEEWADEHGRRYVVTEAHLPAHLPAVQGQQGRAVGPPQGPPFNGMQQVGAGQTGLQQYRQHSRAAPASRPMPFHECDYQDTYPEHTLGLLPTQMGGFLPAEDDVDAAPVRGRYAGMVHDVELSWRQQDALGSVSSTMQVPDPPGTCPWQGQVLRVSVPAQRRAVQGAMPYHIMGQSTQGAPVQRSGIARMAPGMRQAGSLGRGAADEFGVGLDADEADVEFYEEPGLMEAVGEDAAVEQPGTWPAGEPGAGVVHVQMTQKSWLPVIVWQQLYDKTLPR